MQISEKTQHDFAQLNHPIFDTLAADTEDGAAWSQQRIWLAQLVRSQSFETVMGLVIMVNLVLLG
jgi:reverse gyrase